MVRIIVVIMMVLMVIMNDDGDRMMLMALVVTGEATGMVVTMASVIALPGVIYSVNSSRGHRGMSGSSMST